MLKHTRNGSNTSSRSRSPTNSQDDNNVTTVTGQPGGGAISEDVQISLPQKFVVKYLGYRETNNLWGIKYTRRPVDEMVSNAKQMLSTNSDKALPLLKLEVTEDGILVGPMPQNINPIFPNGKFAIETISYGVQDLVYTRVFAMIVVKAESEGGRIKLVELSKAMNNGNNDGTNLPFRCHAFVTDTRETARKLTYALAEAFTRFSYKISIGKIKLEKPKKFAIDLRPPEEIQAELVADSEA